jgi:hypothetical protein
MASELAGSTRSSVAADGRDLLARRLHRDIEELTRHGDRRPQGSGHAAARAYLARRLGDLELQSYTGDGYLARFGSSGANVLGAIHGADRHRRPVVLATNYDGARGSPAASENAAAVAVVLAVVPRLAAASLERGVVVALLDDTAGPRQRDGATGATVLLSQQRRHDVKAAVVLDRLGHGTTDGGEVTLFVTGAETDARMPGILDAVARDGLRLVPVHRRDRRDVTVSAPFAAAGVPYLELCGGHWSGHGTADDTADRVDVGLLVDLVDVVEALVRQLDTVRLPGPFEGYDSSAFEARVRDADHRRDAAAGRQHDE